MYCRCNVAEWLALILHMKEVMVKCGSGYEVGYHAFMCLIKFPILNQEKSKKQFSNAPNLLITF